MEGQVGKGPGSLIITSMFGGCMILSVSIKHADLGPEFLLHSELSETSL